MRVKFAAISAERAWLSLTKQAFLKGCMPAAFYFFAVCSASKRSAACENQPFTATCKNVIARAFYGHQLNIAGQPMADEWVNDDRYADTWTFVFNNKKELFINNQREPIVAQACGSFVASSASTNGLAVSVCPTLSTYPLKV